MLIISFDLQNRTTRGALIIPILKVRHLRPRNVKSFMGTFERKDRAL